MDDNPSSAFLNGAIINTNSLLMLSAATIYGSNTAISVIENATGGSGNDTLVGNAAANTLTGGSGNDSFVFLNNTLTNSGTQITDFSSWQVDTIADFSNTNDTMYFDATSFTAGSGSVGNAITTGQFVTGTNVDANSATGSTIFMYDTDSGNLFYDADGASGSGIHIATLTGSPDDVDNTDFMFV